MSTSAEALNHLLGWWAERFPLSLFLPAAAVLTLAGVAGSSPGWTGTLHRTVLAVVLLLAFRLWDELMDRDRDRETHPHRLLPTVDPGPFWVVMGLLMVGAFGLSGALSPLSPAVLAALILALALYYWRRPGELFLLLKYPLMVLVLRGGLDRIGAVAAVVVYAGVALDEVWLSRAGPPIRAGAMALTVVVLLLLWGAG